MRNLSKVASKTKQLSNITQNHYFSHLSHEKNFEQQKLIQLLQEHSWIQSLKAAKSLHALTITMGSNPIQPNIFLHNNIISKYTSFGNTFLAHQLFDTMPHKNVVSYNTMITGYTRNGYTQNALNLFYEMRYFGLNPTQFTYGALLSCNILNITHGLKLFALIMKSGVLYNDAFTGTSLMCMFGRNGLLEEAIKIFDNMPIKSLITWNCMISLFSTHGYVRDSVLIFKEVIKREKKLSESTFISVLTCLDEDLTLGEQLHGMVIKSGLENLVSLANCLINMYAKCSDNETAEKMFDTILNKDVISWNTIINSMIKNGEPEKAINIFLKSNVLGNETTYSSVINSCTTLNNEELGKILHVQTIKRNLDSNTFVGSTLIDFYAKFNKLQEAHLCFDKIFKKNLVSWNSLILGYSKTDTKTSLLLLKEMIKSHIPNEFSFSAVLKSNLVLLELQELHSMIIKLGYIENKYVISGIISSYAKNNRVSEGLNFAIDSDTSSTSNVIAGLYNKNREYHKTQELYCLLNEPDVISWNILITACSKNGDFKEVFELFEQMRKTEFKPDNYTYVSLFSVCTQICNLTLGSSLHGLIIKSNFNKLDTFVKNIIIDMYGKCGSVKSSVKIFNEMEKRNVISWTVMISTLGVNGYGLKAIKRYREMESEGFKPDKVTFLGIISACRHVGLVKEGIGFFEEMKGKYGIEAEMDHYHVMVDLLVRYGYVKEAEKLISGMPFPPNVLIWRSFLQGCKNKGTKESMGVIIK